MVTRTKNVVSGEGRRDRVESSDIASRLADSKFGRRRALQALLAGATAIVGGLATAIEPAAADCLGSPCCALATCQWCSYSVSRDRYNCVAEGGNRTLWSCTDGSGRLVWCGECSAGTNCYAGPWYCSTWFYN